MTLRPARSTQEVQSISHRPRCGGEAGNPCVSLITIASVILYFDCPSTSIEGSRLIHHFEFAFRSLARSTRYQGGEAPIQLGRGAHDADLAHGRRGVPQLLHVPPGRGDSDPRPQPTARRTSRPFADWRGSAGLLPGVRLRHSIPIEFRWRRMIPAVKVRSSGQGPTSKRGPEKSTEALGCDEGRFDRLPHLLEASSFPAETRRHGPAATGSITALGHFRNNRAAQCQRKRQVTKAQAAAVQASRTSRSEAGAWATGV
jgi:hypothetical protein